MSGLADGCLLGVYGSGDPLYLVHLEQMRILDKFGVQDHSPKKWLAILMEEVGEVATHCISDAELDRDAYRAELVQVAAVACSAVEALDRS